MKVLTPNLNRPYSSGVGLIEVLITLVVIGFGLLAIVSFQGTIISESTLAKVRNEALLYCEAGLNQYRDELTTQDFTDQPEENDPLNPVEFTGSVATYQRTITFGDTVGSSGKVIEASCIDTSGILENPIVVSAVVAPKNLVLGALGPEGDGDTTLSNLSPSLNAGSSDDIAVTINLAESTSRMTAADVTKYNAGELVKGDVIEVTDIDDPTKTSLYVVDTGGLSASYSVTCSDSAVNALPFENGLYAKRYDYYTNTADYYKYYRIDLFEALDTPEDGVRCIPRVRYNGGVIIPISGVIHSGRPAAPYIEVDLFTLNISETGTFCVFNPEEGAVSAPYTCYVGGNCANDTDPSAALQNFGSDNTDFKQCPEAPDPDISAQVTAQAKAHDAITSKATDYYVGEGGWRGNVGLLNIASDISNQGFSVCFGDDLDGSFESRNTARFYYTANSDSDGDTISQGLNQPQACQDFLIMDVFQGNDKFFPDQCDEIFGAKFPDSVESKVVYRDLDIGTTVQNTYNSAINYYPNSDTPSCTGAVTYTLTGTITNPYGIPEVRVKDGTIDQLCDVYDNPDNSPDAPPLVYECTFTSRQQYVTISATQNSTEYPNATDSSDEEIFWCSNANVTPSYAPSGTDEPCDFTLVDVSDGDGVYEYTVTGVVVGSAGAEGLNELRVQVFDSTIGRDIFYGCVIDAALDTFACPFKLSQLAENIVYVLSPSANSGYEIVPASESSIDASSDQTFGEGSRVAGPHTIEVNSLDSFVYLSGTITDPTGANSEIDVYSPQAIDDCPVVGDQYSCAFEADTTNVTVSYTITVPTNQCTQSAPIKHLEVEVTDPDGVTSSTRASHSILIDQISTDLRADVLITKSSGPGNDC